MERLELLPWFMNIQKDKWTLGFQKCIFYRHFRGWTGKIVWKFSINFKSILFLLFLHKSNPSKGPFLFWEYFMKLQAMKFWIKHKEYAWLKGIISSIRFYFVGNTLPRFHQDFVFLQNFWNSRAEGRESANFLNH